MGCQSMGDHHAPRVTPRVANLSTCFWRVVLKLENPEETRHGLRENMSNSGQLPKLRSKLGTWWWKHRVRGLHENKSSKTGFDDEASTSGHLCSSLEAQDFRIPHVSPTAFSFVHGVLSLGKHGSSRPYLHWAELFLHQNPLSRDLSWMLFHFPSMTVIKIFPFHILCMLFRK